ncbi:MAG: hypothetical protein B6U97_00140 [Candidatus Altiarchaeales archaeon ex4484_96]|nr:MAG: hypothetical protein B6U97_00140 [Candidatus Altiarchaeales archaeon ex4484_96]
MCPNCHSDHHHKEQVKKHQEKEKKKDEQNLFDIGISSFGLEANRTNKKGKKRKRICLIFNRE